MVATFISLLISTAIVLYLGVYILHRGKNEPAHRSFFFFALNIAVWSAFVAGVVLIRDRFVSLFLIRAAFAAAIFIPSSFLAFVNVFPGRPPAAGRRPAWLPFVASGLLAGLSFSPWLIQEIGFEVWGPESRYGFLLPIYIAVLFIIFFRALWILGRKRRRLTGIKRLQVQYVFLGVLLSLLLSSATSLILPLFKTSQFGVLGPLFSFVLVGFIAYAIARYQLMDLSVIIRKTTLYVLLTGSVTLGYIGIVLLSNWLFSGFMGRATLVPAMIAALLIAFAFVPVKESIQRFIDSSIFRKRYDHRRILGDLSRVFTSIFSLRGLLEITLENVTDAMGIERGIIFIRENDSGYHPQAWILRPNPGEALPFLPLDDPLVRALEGGGGCIIREQYERHPGTAISRSAVPRRMEELGGEICVPIFLKEALTGVLLASAKTTGEAYTREDIEMFSTLSHQLAVAVENARLYTQEQESKIYQENLLDNLTSGVIAIDPDFRITVFNRKAEEILGLPADRVLGGKSELLPPEFYQALQEAWREKRQTISREIVLKPPSGREIPLSLSFSVFGGPDGGCLGVLALVTDLTEKKILEGEIRRTDRLAMLGTLAAGMAHEIKNPLVSLKTYFQLLPQKYAEKEFQTDFAGLAVQEVERINCLVEQLVNYARPSSPSFKPTNVREVLENTLMLIRSRLSEQEIDLEPEFPDHPLIIQGDGEQLKQVFLNMIINSLQAMSRGGILKIKVRLDARPETGAGDPRGPGARRPRSGDWLAVDITDTGAGIAPENIPRLFDLFFSTKEEGTGLGLAIADSIINEHGGTISIRSRIGEGSTFSIALPLRPPDEALK